MQCILTILDGFGINTESELDDAIRQAGHPVFQKLFSEPHAKLWTHGRCVGLPDGQMGGSEVGHLTIGAGRVCPQTLVRVDALCQWDIQDHPEYAMMIEYMKTHNKRLHIFMVLSDGGVHSHISHLQSLLTVLPENIDIQLHVASDGRDTPTQSLPLYLQMLKPERDSDRIHISTLCGRYFTFDRADNWDRIEKAYTVMTQIDRNSCPDSAQIFDIVQKRYETGVIDEHHEPIAFSDGRWITDGDAVWCLNFRADRCREITQVFSEEDFTGFSRKKLDVFYMATCRYYPAYQGHFLLDELDIRDTLPEVLSKAGKTQLHISETDKFIHVTKFLAGLRSEPFAGQVNKGFTSYTGWPFAEKPEMEADEMCDYIIEQAENFDFTVVNFPNGDLVGHCGDFEACKKAVYKLGDVTGRLIEYTKTHDIMMIVTADHGNCERMGTSENPDTAHTQFPVPCWIIRHGEVVSPKVLESDLTALAPTVLEIMGIKKPEVMTWVSLI
jgi:2,3-bisphosphoglycerate-independent phosphoglycerate mutase